MATNATDLSGGIPVEREYVLDGQPEPGVRDAVNVWIEEESGAFAMRLGVEAVADAWDHHDVWLDVVFAEGRLYQRRGTGERREAIGPEGLATVREAGPMAFRCVEPFRLWTAAFEGEADVLNTRTLIDTPSPDAGELLQIDLGIDVAMTMAAVPWIPGSLLPEAAAALGGEQGTFMSPRYEQLFRCEGSLRIDGEERAFSGKGLRIRRTGFRAFSGFAGHCWQSALFPSGRAFGFCIYPPREDGEPSYAEGFVIDERGRRIAARPAEVPWLRRLVTGGEDVSFTLETVDGQRVSVAGETFANVRSRGHAVLPPDFPIVQQAHARYTWDGEQTVGMIERSSKPSVMEF